MRMERFLVLVAALVFASAEAEEEQEVLHSGEDCWSSCNNEGGWCDWCGAGNACCRWGWLDYPPECKQAVDFPVQGYHTCVAIPEVSNGDFKMGATVLGSISTVVILYYLVNYHDVDMRRYTYSILSETTSIFCAVLMYGCVNQLAQEYILRSLALYDVLIWRLLLLWFFECVISFALLKVSGLIYTSRARQKEICEDVDERMRTKNHLAACAIFSHMTGFVGIGFWTTIQTKISPFYSSPLNSCLLVPIYIVWATIFITIGSVHRFSTLKKWKADAPDNSELKELCEVYVEAVEDAEHDVVGIVGAFLIVQSIRFAVGQQLPGEDGYEGPALFSHTAKQAGQLYACSGVAFLILMGFVAARDYKKSNKSPPSATAEPLLQVNAAGAAAHRSKHSFQVDFPILGRRSLMSKEQFKKNVVRNRGFAICKATLAMVFAWTAFYATQMMISCWRVSGRDITVVDILTAVLSSYVIFVLIRIMDKVADHHWLGNLGERAIRRTISAFGIVIGFSWEKSFDVSVDAVAAYSPLAPLWTKMALALLALCLIMPAWALYIIPMAEEHGYRYGFVARKVVQRVEGMIGREEEGGEMRLGEFEEVLRKLTSVKDGKYFRLLVTHDMRKAQQARSSQLKEFQDAHGEVDEELLS